ncbi:Arm DNA-binding domain-containing protein [Mucilaginibacter sabulilitoris]|uniref:Arm DNA-binding domain-containing protein n=1 Tax=Mucilaginibacter sabulilitoris TaxID=1173583 RepID=A0ABZ0TFA1_9SPHI|nr:Arm DNA-binding domain-containing protein [Mucilaginibacter sabulilitoris]WPU91856.1 Arm DNA-binding domain-containing protein [Mucilaginibacter sabulilitoris]
MIKNVAVLFYLKKRANSKEEKVPVYVRITCDGQRAELATGKKIQSKLWNPNEGRAKGKAEAVYKLNLALNDVALRINDTIRYLKDCGEEQSKKSKIGSWVKLKNQLCWLTCLRNIIVKLQPWQIRSLLPLQLPVMKRR